MLIEDINMNQLYQLLFVIALLGLSLTFFVVLIRYTGWMRIRLDRLVQLYQQDRGVTESSIHSLTIIAKSKGMLEEEPQYDENGEEIEIEEDSSEVRAGRYRKLTDL